MSDENGNVEGGRDVDLRRLFRLDEYTLRTAFEFETELREVFGLHFIDGELDAALLPAIEVILDKAEKATKRGLAVAAIYTLMKHHPRGFARYFAGTDRPYPRSSKEVQAEIDSGKPLYMANLYDELKDALEEEQQSG